MALASALLVLLFLGGTAFGAVVTNSYATPGTYNWVCPVGVTSVQVECRGGGGAGGGAQGFGVASGNSAAKGGGGAGGSYASNSVIVTPGSSYTIFVGGGGVSPATVVNGGTNPGQASFFSNAVDTVVYGYAEGGAGGVSEVNTLGTGGVTGSGGAGSTGASLGSVVFAGGSGANANAQGSGGGGGGAGDAQAGSNAVVNVAGGGGLVGGGAGGAGVTTLNTAGTNGVAPGGGGGGSWGRTTTQYPGGAGGNGKVVLIYTTAIDHFVVTTTAASPQTAGAAFTITITAQDAGNTTVNDSTTVVTVINGGGLLQFDWNNDGTYGDNSGTLNSGVWTLHAVDYKAETTTITASAGGPPTVSPPSVTTVAGPFSQMQLLAPGQTATPGIAPGHTGLPSVETAGSAFSVTVNAVDQYWNLVNTISDSVAISSTDSLATLPANNNLAAGTQSFGVTLNSLNHFSTVTATDVTDGTKTANTSPAITLAGDYFKKADNSLDLTNAASWVGGVVPGTNQWATWDATVATAANCTNNWGSNPAIGGIRLLNPAAAVYLTNNSSAFGINGVGSNPAVGLDASQATVDLTFNCPFGINRNQTWSNAANHTVTIASGNAIGVNGTVWTLDGPGAYVFNGGLNAANARTLYLVKNGTGSLTLSAINDPKATTGLVTLNAGTLNLNNAQALGGAATNATGKPNPVTFEINGGTLDNTSGGPLTLTNNPMIWNGNFSFTGSTNLNLGNGAVALTNGNVQMTASANTLEVDGTISDTNPSGTSLGCGLTKLGAGTLVLGGANTYTGNTTVNGGTLALQQPALFTNSTVTVASSGVLALNFGVTNQVSALVLNGLSLPPGIYNSATLATTPYGGYITGTGSLLVTPATATAPTALGIGTVSLSGTNLVISGTNAGAGTFYVLASTNLTSGLSQWQAVATNTVAASGSFILTITNAVNGRDAQRFFILSTTTNN